VGNYLWAQSVLRLLSGIDLLEIKMTTDIDRLAKNSLYLDNISRRTATRKFSEEYRRHQTPRVTRRFGNWPTTFMPPDSFGSKELIKDMKPTTDKNPFNWGSRLTGSDVIVCDKCGQSIERRLTWSSTPKEKRHACLR